MKLHAQLEQTFKMRINANSEIIPYIKKLSEMGKFDEPKKIAAIAILLDRLGKLEDEAETEKSLQELTEPIQSEIDVAKTAQEETVLQATDSPMSGTDTVIDDTNTEKTVTTFTPEAIVDPLDTPASS